MTTNPLDRMRELADVINTSDRHMYETNPEWVKACEYAARRILYILSSSDGWVCVPFEPTEAMKRAGGHVNSEWLNDNAPIGEDRYVTPMGGVYKAMIRASKEPS